MYRIFNPGSRPEIDSRLDDSQDALVASLSALTIRHDDLPTRPGFGTVGQEIKLRTNFFPIKVPRGPLYEYDVKITPDKGTANKRMRRRIFQLAEETADWSNNGLKGIVAHDHASKVIAAKQLPQPLTITVPFYDEDQDESEASKKEYVLTFNFVQPIDTQSLIR